MRKKSFANILLNLPFPEKEKLFCLLRYLSVPFYQLENLTPKSGYILDIGCGHGIFDIILKSEAKKRKILGLDLDEKKIKLAKKLQNRFKKDFFFKKTSVFELNGMKFDFITMLDVDYLLKKSEKIKLLEKVKKLLKKEGQFLIKTVINDNSFGYYLGYIQEIITVNLFKKTFSKNNSFNFLTKKEYLDLFELLEYSVLDHGKLKKRLYHPHYYFLVKNR